MTKESPIEINEQSKMPLKFVVLLLIAVAGHSAWMAKLDYQLELMNEKLDTIGEDNWSKTDQKEFSTHIKSWIELANAKNPDLNLPEFKFEF